MQVTAPFCASLLSEHMCVTQADWYMANCPLMWTARGRESSPLQSLVRNRQGRQRGSSPPSSPGIPPPPNYKRKEWLTKRFR